MGAVGVFSAIKWDDWSNSSSICGQTLSGGKFNLVIQPHESQPVEFAQATWVALEREPSIGDRCAAWECKLLPADQVHLRAVTRGLRR